MSEPEFIELEESDINTIDVYVEPLELYKLLKIANLVGGGGEAKMLIADGYVGVNGELCQQKRKKIYQGDLVEFNGEFLQIRLVEGSSASLAQESQLQSNEQRDEPAHQAKAEKRNAAAKHKSKAKPGKANQGKSASKKKSGSDSKKRSPSGRRSISF